MTRGGRAQVGRLLGVGGGVSDFTEDAREASKWVPKGHVTDLGCCVRPATAVSLVKLNGTFFIQHAVLWPPCDD